MPTQNKTWIWLVLAVVALGLFFFYVGPRWAG
jgi:hypothetical protein